MTKEGFDVSAVGRIFPIWELMKTCSIDPHIRVPKINARSPQLKAGMPKASAAGIVQSVISGATGLAGGLVCCFGVRLFIKRRKENKKAAARDKEKERKGELAAMRKKGKKGGSSGSSSS